MNNLSFDLILKSTLAWIKEKRLEPEIKKTTTTKNKGDQFSLKNNMKIL